MVSEYVTSLIVVLLLLGTRQEKIMSRAPMVEPRNSALESTLWSYNTHIGEQESPLATKNPGFHAGIKELDSTKCLLHCTEDDLISCEGRLEVKGLHWYGRSRTANPTFRRSWRRKC